MGNLVFLTGAGMSAESGIKTFRGSDGLWENYRITDVATPQAWLADQKLVLEFYNQRRKQVIESIPNQGHLDLVKFESHFNVDIVTQNIDDLHERAGSSRILHLHGEIRKSQSSVNADLVYPIEGKELNLGEYCELGTQLRPHVVWFGEAVPKMDEAIGIVEQADVLVVIGTSLQVYPAAGLAYSASSNCKIFLIDPSSQIDLPNRCIHIQQPASTGVAELLNRLI